MKRKFPLTVFVLLIITNILHVIVYIANEINSYTIAHSLFAAVVYYIVSGGILYLALPAVVYSLLAIEDNKKNRVGYIIAVVTLILQICFGTVAFFFIALSSIEGGSYWVALIYYSIAFLLTIVAIVYSKKYLKLKVFNQKK